MKLILTIALVAWIGYTVFSFLIVKINEWIGP